PGAAFAAEAQKALTDQDILSIFSVVFKTDTPFGGAARSDLTMVERVTVGNRRFLDVTGRVLKLPVICVVVDRCVTVVLDADLRAQPLAERIVPGRDLGSGDVQPSDAQLLTRVTHNVVFGLARECVDLLLILLKFCSLAVGHRGGRGVIIAERS